MPHLKEGLEKDSRVKQLRFSKRYFTCFSTSLFGSPDILKYPLLEPLFLIVLDAFIPGII
jgi:hypothetical protein